MKSLEFVQEDAKKFENEKPLSVCTAVHRDNWTAARKHLISNLGNKESMKIKGFGLGRKISKKKKKATQCSN